MSNYDDIFAGQATDQRSREFAPFDKESWAAQKQQERESAYQRIDDTVLQMARNGELFRTFLDVQSRFDRYSVSNAVLITAQMPNATRLADFDTWKSDGAYVKKGAVGISILEPGNEYERDDGSTGVSYNLKKVFDISQTNSRKPAVPEKATDMRETLKALISNAPCKIEISSELPDGINAAYQPQSRTVFIRQGMDGSDIFRSLTQELAHAHMDKGDYNRKDCAFSAYCVAYMLCKRNGVAVDNFRFDRLPDHLRDMDARGIRDELGKIRDVTNEISGDMARALDRQREQKNRDAR